VQAFLSTYSTLEQAVQIAVGIDSQYFFTFQEGKAYLRSISGFQSFALVAAGRLQRDPLNVMGFGHGMVYSAYGNIYDVVLDFIYGYMLFGSAVTGAGDDLLHGFSAADYRYTLVFYFSNDLSAVRTAIELHFHNFLLFPVKPG